MAKQVTGATPSSTPSPSLANNQIFPARVKGIILDDSDSNLFKSYGEWSATGLIFFERIAASNPEQNPDSNNYARPLFSNQKYYPLKNEVVYIISLSNSNIQGSVNSTSYYYFQPVNLWTSNHHNAIPNPLAGNSLPDEQKRDYEQTALGSVRKVTDGGTEIDLGSTFSENLNIKTILPYEGDIIYEGRWGQSLRFGSTVNNSFIPNPWSQIGNNGDPITILRNSQYDDGNDPWVPQVEDINKEGSSVYITSTQIIPIEVSSKSYKSYSKAPTTPDKYDGEQILLNSGRLVLNAKTDSILLSSLDTINLNSVGSVNIDAPKTVIQSNEVSLGDLNAKESLILGDTFLNDLSKLLSQMITLSAALQTPIGAGPPFAINPAIAPPAVQVQNTATQMFNKISTYKSKVSRTK